MLDLIIKKGKCYIDKDLKDVDIGIQNSKIVKIGKLDEDASKSIDANSLALWIGLCIVRIDTVAIISTRLVQADTALKVEINSGFGNKILSPRAM